MEEEKIENSLAMEEPKEPEREEEKEEQKEEQEEKKEEEQEKEEEKKEEMSLDANLDVKALLEMLAGETEGYEKIAEEEFSKPESERNFAKVCSAMYGKMCKMGEKMCKMEEENKAYMSECEELRKYKADMDANQKAHEVEGTLRELCESVDVPMAELEEMRSNAENFSLKDIDAWKNYCKAKAFNFAVKNGKKEDTIVRYGLPFAGKPDRKSDSPWSR